MNSNHEQKKKKIKRIGKILLIVGGILSIVGIGSFFMAVAGGGFPSLFFLAFIGFPMVGFGGMLTSVGYKREIGKYMKDESMPIIKEAYDDLHPEIKDMVSLIKGEDSDIECTYCGTKNDYNARYCKSCGREIKDIRCPHCGSLIDVDSNYCSSCGKEIR